jgi:4-diphosphocytidyl-2-C-methyl-D-erythritol kinase
MISFANAKINLGLYVTEKRIDGFHNLESIFLPVSVSDVLEIIPDTTDACSFQTVGIEIDGNNEENLCVKACLLKNTPIGAGLGGGSSDGVQMLKALNEIFELKISEDRMLKYAAQLGSDCPFFVRNEPTFVTGRGDIMHPIQLNLKGTFVIIVHPGVHISTPIAYSLIVPTLPNFDLRNIHSLDKKNWQKVIRNDFEAPMIHKFPVIGEIKKQLLENGAFYSAMSGSGSAVYGLFDQEKDLRHLFPDFFYREAHIS